MLYLYSVFHLNLMYSSIETGDRPGIVEKCYWPLLRLADSMQIPAGIELSGYTLERIKEIDPGWIEKFKGLLKEKRIELIGSGYAQIIGPLVPARVNDWNQRLGLEVYKDILGTEPQIALVNEMAYSAGIVEHYLNNGYKAVIMEWNNPRKYHPEWKNEWRYFPQKIVGACGRDIQLIWADSIAFQKFQRYAQGEIELEEYLDCIKIHNSKTARYLCLYANDAEIFDVRPNRYPTELKIDKRGEWRRIRNLFENIKRYKRRFKLVKPSSVLQGERNRNGGHKLFLQSAEQPIPVKKQEKYNINRWAVSGRGDLSVNTACYAVYAAFLNAEPDKEAQKELCYLWSSDFRTHITKRRWVEFTKRLSKLKGGWIKGGNKTRADGIRMDTVTIRRARRLSIKNEGRFLTVETKGIKCTLNKFRGLSIGGLWFKDKNGVPLAGTLPHGYYEDISLGADFYSGHSIIERAGEHKITDLLECGPQVYSSRGMAVIRCKVINRDIVFNKEYRINTDKDSVEIMVRIELPGRVLSSIYPVNFTFVPASFNKNTLFYAVHNGGAEMEIFDLRDNVIDHTQSFSSLISAKHAAGATEGVFIIGDNKKSVYVRHCLSDSAVIPSVHYLPLDKEKFFLRLKYSAQEMDDTFVAGRGRTELVCRWTVSAFYGRPDNVFNMEMKGGIK